MLTEQFNLPKDCVYMCGHSLGPSLKNTSTFLKNTLDDFDAHGVSAWNKSDWFDLPFLLGEKIAQLVGANTGEVLVCDSTVVNLFKVLKAAIRLQKNRKLILTTEDNFPADLYIADGISEVKQVSVEYLLENINETVGVLMLTHVSYRDAQVLDMKKINALAKKYNVLTVWDLSHSIGIVPLALNDCQADFAIGCTYKYLSGGPGSPAFIYANKQHLKAMESPIKGWLGHDEPFSFQNKYASTGIKKFMAGTPNIFSMKGLQAALELFDVDVIEKNYEKANLYSLRLIEAFEKLAIQVFKPKTRGGHVAFSHPFGYGFSRALIENGFICDYRAPDLIRLCINPLYISLTDIDACIALVEKIILNNLYLKPEYNQPQKVT